MAEGGGGLGEGVMRKINNEQANVVINNLAVFPSIFLNKCWQVPSSKTCHFHSISLVYIKLLSIKKQAAYGLPFKKIKMVMR